MNGKKMENFFYLKRKATWRQHHPPHQYSDLQTYMHNPSHTQGVHPVNHIFTALCFLCLDLIIQILAEVAAIHPARCLEVCIVSSTTVSCLLSLQMLLIAITLLKDISSTLFFITCQNSHSEESSQSPACFWKPPLSDNS